VSNQRSRADRLFPLGRMRIPNRSSPRMTGSTAMSGSCARSHATTRGSGAGFVGSLKTLASTRYFTAHPSTQSRWARRSPSADRRAASRWRPEAIVPTINTLDVELLPRFDAVHLPKLRRQNDLALGGDGGLHAGKIPSYRRQYQAHRRLGLLIKDLLAVAYALRPCSEGIRHGGRGMLRALRDHRRLSACATGLCS